MQPVGEVYTYRELLDGSLTLLDVARAHDWMTVKAENRHRAREANRDG